MKKIVCFSGIFVFFLLTATVYAHPPSDIKVTFDPKTKILSALIIHDVSNPATHFIKKVDVSLNGKEIVEQAISRQDNPNSQAVSYLIPDFKEGDRLAVEGYCSISGKLEKQLR
jgi:hypothetical protein